QAYCDGALDPVAAAEFERRMTGDAALRARHDRIMALRRALRSLPADNPPRDLLARVTSAVDAESSAGHGWPWRAMAAALLTGIILTSGAMLAFDRYNAHQEVASRVVANHIRALLAPQPFDVASSDRHTVKPWFTTRVPESPQVVDLASQGFTLAGGRVDVIGRDPVATIVYKRAQHAISLTTLRPGQSFWPVAIAGYNVRSWSDRDFTYVAVSDLPNEDIEAFERAFTAGQSR
ncbi:MAG: anti-sigma factor, partial [Rhizobiales bacterium]|nr:anti-sigma factor [Hyphomicrobiales bacterium]